jgi:hypothetical protein
VLKKKKKKMHRSDCYKRIAKKGLISGNKYNKERKIKYESKNFEGNFGLSESAKKEEVTKGEQRMQKEEKFLMNFFISFLL